MLPGLVAALDLIPVDIQASQAFLITPIFTRSAWTVQPTQKPSMASSHMNPRQTQTSTSGIQ